MPVSSSVSSAFLTRYLSRLPATVPLNDFPRGSISRLQPFLYVQASKFARLPDRQSVRLQAPVLAVGTLVPLPTLWHFNGMTNEGAGFLGFLGFRWRDS